MVRDTIIIICKTTKIIEDQHIVDMKSVNIEE